MQNREYRSFFGLGAACVAIAAVTNLAGCGTVARGLPSITSAPWPVPAIIPPVSYIYTLRTGDVLAVRFPLNPELNDDVVIGPDGKISLADAENVVASGRSASDVAAELRHDYLKVLREPRLSVAVKSFAQVPVFVGGEVVAPGEFRNDVVPLTLSQAIARAGGLRTSGSASRIFLIRRGAQDAPLVYAVQYDDVIRGVVATDVRLAPYDLVYVPRTSVAEAFVYFNQYVQQFVPINWGFSYQINPYPTQNAK